MQMEPHLGPILSSTIKYQMRHTAKSATGKKNSFVNRGLISFKDHTKSTKHCELSKISSDSNQTPTRLFESVASVFVESFKGKVLFCFAWYVNTFFTSLLDSSKPSERCK